jgi:hypothetical protein
MDDYICLSSLTIRKLFIALIIEFEDTKANSISLKLRRIKFHINNFLLRLIEKNNKMVVKDLMVKNVATGHTGQG